ncbi:hypothetical protein [Ekhidna sp.]
MNKKTLIILLCSISLSQVYGQQWSGSNNTSDLISRTGEVETGIFTAKRSSSPNFNFVRDDNSITNGSVIGQINFRGPNQFGGFIVARSVGSWGSNVNQAGTQLEFWTQDKTTNANLESRMLIDHNGNVGIGTTDPFEGTTNSGLQINSGNHSSLLLGNPVDGNYGGIVQTSDSRHRIFIGANLYDDESNSWKSFKAGKGSAGISIMADEDNWGTSISFYASESDNDLENRLIIKGDGSIGIGTITPTEKLEVNGNIRTREITVEASPWPDYVFEAGYELKSLKEVASFIKENGHLPNIPSSKEVEENGVKLGKMNALLLEKIEELMLHTIKQQEQIDQQNSIIKELIKKDEL